MTYTSEFEMSEKTHRHLAIVQDEKKASEKAADSRVFPVGELAKMTGKTVRAIHLYESMGLLAPVERTAGRYRLFNADSVERVSWIVKLQAVGFSLPEIQEIVKEQESASTGQDAAAHLKGVYRAKLEAVQGKLAELRRLERELVASMNYLDACQSACDSGAPVNNCPSCDRHADQPEQPSLVAGLHVT